MNTNNPIENNKPVNPPSALEGLKEVSKSQTIEQPTRAVEQTPATPIEAPSVEAAPIAAEKASVPTPGLPQEPAQEALPVAEPTPTEQINAPTESDEKMAENLYKQAKNSTDYYKTTQELYAFINEGELSQDN